MKQVIFFIVCVSLIPAAFADVNTPNANAQLLQAAKDSNLPAVQKSLASGADINARNDNGATALILAAEKGYTEIVSKISGC